MFHRWNISNMKSVGCIAGDSTYLIFCNI